MNHKQEYGRAWRAYRKYSGENEVLAQVLHDRLQLRPGRSCLVDVGCGDAALTTKVVEEGLLDCKPSGVFLLEPSSFLHEIAAANAGATLQPRQIPYEMVQRSLNGFDPSPSCEHGFVYSIHASYYFDDGDVETIARMRESGLTVLVVENHDDCWVSQVMQKIGNTTHPQFDKTRYGNLIDALGLKHEQVEVESHPAELSSPSTGEIRSMADFFSWDWSGRPETEELHERLRRAFAEVCSQNPRFVYRILTCPPS